MKVKFEYISNSAIPSAFVQNDNYSCGHVCLDNILRTFAPNTATEIVEKMSKSEMLLFLLHDYCLDDINRLTNPSLIQPKSKSRKKNLVKRLKKRNLT